MARGFTDIYLSGGARDGFMMKQIPINQLSYALSFSGDTFFAETDGCGVAVMKGPLNDRWISYKEDIYTKVNNDNRGRSEGGVNYEFLKSAIVERCSSITKKNTRCLHAAIEGALHCNTHAPRR